jgi:AraC-like DNA-binding protein
MLTSAFNFILLVINSLGQIDYCRRNQYIVIFDRGEKMENTSTSDPIRLVSSKNLPYYRSVNSLAVLANFMEEMGIDAATLLEGSGIQPQDLGNPYVFVTPEQELLVLRKIPKLAEDPKIGLIIGQQYHAGVHGKLGAAGICSDTFLDVVRLVMKYTFLTLTYFQYDLRVKDNLVLIKMRELIDLKDIRVFVCEREFVSIHRMASDVLGAPLVLNELHLAYPKPEYASAYKDVFQCPVHFNAHEHMMTFDHLFLNRKLPMSNPMARKTYEKECEQLYLRLKMMETVTNQVRDKIMFQSEGLPSFSRLARSMNISVSTLRRRLTEEGTSFKILAAEILQKKAIDMIQTTSNPIEQIAIELGYSDLANFHRAFKGWTGHNPSYYRKKN